MAPSTPPPPSRALLAALTIASTASPVMSPRIAVNLSVTDWSPECSCYDPRDRSCKLMAITTSKTLTLREQAKPSRGPASAEAKLALLMRLEHRRLRTARAVIRLHEILCFLRAYPDNARVLAQTERMLGNFHRRFDLRRHRAALSDSGIAGTAITYRFYWSTAHWLARRWPEWFQFDRGDIEPAERGRAGLPLLVTPAGAAWLKQRHVSAFEG